MDLLSPFSGSGLEQPDHVRVHCWKFFNIEWSFRYGIASPSAISHWTNSFPVTDFLFTDVNIRR